LEARVAARTTGGATGQTTPGASFFAPREISFRSGDGAVPRELNAAIDAMRVGEEATVWVGPRVVATGSEAGSEGGEGSEGGSEGGSEDFGNFGDDASSATTPLVRYSEAADRLGATFSVVLVGMTHARDVFGDGTVMKRRVVEGPGDFPADCPLHDCRVEIRLEVEAEAEACEGAEVHRARDEVRPPADGAETAAFRLGCGAAPEALETAVRLMIPGETSVVT
jgi:hypothetical protein